MDASNWITLIVGLGLGSGLTALLQHQLKKREVAYTSQRQDLEKRYRAIILLMYAAYGFDGNQTTLRINRPDLSTRESVLEELKAEWFNMLLFASENTQKSLHSFILNPTLSNLKIAAVSMRKDPGRGDFGKLVHELEFGKRH